MRRTSSRERREFWLWTQEIMHNLLLSIYRKQTWLWLLMFCLLSAFWLGAVTVHMTTYSTWHQGSSHMTGFLIVNRSRSAIWADSTNLNTPYITKKTYSCNLEHYQDSQDFTKDWQNCQENCLVVNLSEAENCLSRSRGNKILNGKWNEESQVSCALMYDKEATYSTHCT